MTTKCGNCCSKSNDLHSFSSKFLDGKNGCFCDICFQQTTDKENNEMKELKTQGMDLSIYCKSQKPVNEVPTAVPIITPAPTIIQNITINNINNNINNITKNKHIHFDNNKDKKEEQTDKVYDTMLKEEEYRIKRLREMQKNKLWYSKCARCKHNKHFSDYNLILDKDGKPMKLNKLYGIDKPLTEEGESMYRRTMTCSNCLDNKKEKDEENKHRHSHLKEDNTHKCECGGSFFLGLSNQISEFNKLRHERTKKHMEYMEKQRMKDNVHIDFNLLKISLLKKICKLNGIKGYTHINKEDIVENLIEKQKELELNKNYL